MTDPYPPLTTDIENRLRLGMGHVSFERNMQEGADEIKRLCKENEDLRRWKAMDKPMTAAMAVVNNDVVALRAEIERLRAAYLYMVEWNDRLRHEARAALEQKP